MVPHRSPRRLPWLALAVFAVSGLLVLSFILFEVLDIDGSDFPIPGTAAGQWMTLSEGTHDIRRILSGGEALGGAKTLPQLGVPLAPRDDHQRRHLAENYSLPIRIEQHSHLGLPRASLDYPPVG